MSLGLGFGKTLQCISHVGLGLLVEHGQTMDYTNKVVHGQTHIDLAQDHSQSLMIALKPPSFAEGFHLSLLELTTHACSARCTTDMTIDMENKHD